MDSYQLRVVYARLKRRYFPNSNVSPFMDDKSFIDLAKMLDREAINGEKYIDFVFGILDYPYPLTPKGLTNPILMAKFKDMVR